MDEKVLKTLQPTKYLRDFISKNIRPDGRGFHEYDVSILHPNSISTADGSSIVVMGSTKMCCGIKAELTKPTIENPNSGFLVVNLDLPALCSPLFKLGPPGDLVQACNQLVTDIINDSKCINLNDLCISKEKLVWVIYCDVICLNYGGSIIDAALLAIVSALKTAKLPTVEYDAVSENCVVHEDKRIPLKIIRFPISTSFAVFERDVFLINPTDEEEQQCGGVLGGITVVWSLSNQVDGDNQNDKLQGVHHLGGNPLKADNLQHMIDSAKKRSYHVKELIFTLTNTKESSQ